MLYSFGQAQNYLAYWVVLYNCIWKKYEYAAHMELALTEMWHSRKGIVLSKTGPPGQNWIKDSFVLILP